jgi:putative ABC transport system ATP-binding protein
MLRIKELQVAYGNICAVKGLNLEVHQGELVCLIGSNGAGKSTTLKAIAGLIIPTHGEIHLQAWRICGRPEELLARGLALVPEGRGVFAGMTVLENLQMASWLATGKKHTKRAKKLLEQLGIENQAEKLPSQLSIGQQQRVSIARALMNEPKVLLADEPTSSLDDKNAEKVIDLLTSLSKEYKAALLIVTHDNRIKEKFINKITLV